MKARTCTWIVAGALSAACATGAFTEPHAGPSVRVEYVEGASSISGIVTLRGTNEMLPGALVLLSCDCLEGQREAVTNPQGVFGFPDLPAGRFTVTVLHAHDQLEQAVEVSPQCGIRLRFALSDEHLVRT